MKKKTCIFIGGLLVLVIIAAGLAWHLSDPSLSVAYQVEEQSDCISIQVTVTNIGHAVRCWVTTEGPEECFGRANLSSGNTAIYQDMNTDWNIVPAVVPVEAWFRHRESAVLTYKFPKDLLPGTYDLRLIFNGQKLSCQNVLTVLANSETQKEPATPPNAHPPVPGKNIHLQVYYPGGSHKDYTNSDSASEIATQILEHYPPAYLVNNAKITLLFDFSFSKSEEYEQLQQEKETLSVKAFRKKLNESSKAYHEKMMKLSMEDFPNIACENFTHLAYSPYATMDIKLQDISADALYALASMTHLTHIIIQLPSDPISE